MSYPTLIVDPEALAAPAARVEGDEYRHLFRARRLARGAAVRLVDGAGHAAWSRIERVSGRHALLRLEGPAETNEPSLELEVWCALPRRQRASWLVEKATEIGVAAVRWIDCQRAVHRVSDDLLARLDRVARAAVEQSHRARVPEVSGPHAWAELIDATRRDAACLLDPEAAETPAAAVEGRSILIVGPEGGFTDDERSALVSAGARRLGLGPRVLRLETAVVVGASRLLGASRPSPGERDGVD